jgi:hypothetical protein
MKTTVYFDRLYFQTLEQAHQLALPFLNQVCEKYQALSLGPITSEILEKIAAGDFSGIKTATEAILEADLKKSGFKTKAIIRDLRASAAIEFEEFKSTASQLMAKVQGYAYFSSTGHYPIEIRHFSIREGMAHLTEEDLQRLKDEYCTDYLETDLQIQVWEKLQNAAAALTEVTSLLKENGIQVPIFFTDGTPGFISAEDHEVQIHGELIHAVK